MVLHNPYDELLYPGYPFVQTHPDHLATLATLFGMKPSPVETCRVLELGCGDGANLIPIAFGLPRSEFVGIDLAGRPIARANALAVELGLKNISLRQCDVMELSDAFGKFDYIIAHGLYSWVSPAAQDTILAICKCNLTPQGVAYVSYNVYPGGHLRQMARDMMLFHARGVRGAQDRVSRARELIRFLTESQVESDAYKKFVKQELERVLKRSDEALYHDDLGEINAPLYFYQFVEHASRHGLQYLTEAELTQSQTGPFPAFLIQRWEELGHDLIAQEQYLDFLKCRMFRQTLLCHYGVVLDRSLKPQQMKEFYLASAARPVNPVPEIRTSAVEEFRSVNGVTLSTSTPIAKAALFCLGESWPQSMSFDDLRKKALSLLALDECQADQFSSELCEVLLKSYGWNVVELHVHQPRFVATASERPVVSHLARMQAERGHTLTTLRHTMVEVKDDLARKLLRLLDGTRDRGLLMRELTAAVESGEIAMERSAAQPDEQMAAAKISLDELEQKLSELARLALLVA